MKIALKKTPVMKFPMGPLPAETKEDMYESLLSIRGWMLRDTDWTQSNDSPLNDATKEAWRLWRQELRDITKHINVENIEDYFEVSDPPQQGRPETWHGWEYENYYSIIQIFDDINSQTEEIMKQQHEDLNSTVGNHVH